MRILKVRDGISWKDFQVEYRKFFRISYEPKALEVMGKEFKRLTGRDPVDEKPKRNERSTKSTVSNRVKTIAEDNGPLPGSESDIQL